METLQEILRKSNTLLIPQEAEGSSGSLTSPQNIAQIMATYNHVSAGGGQNLSNKMAEQLLGGNFNPDTIKTILADLENIKSQQKGQLGNEAKGYRYLDDKTLYSTD